MWTPDVVVEDGLKVEWEGPLDGYLKPERIVGGVSAFV